MHVFVTGHRGRIGSVITGLLSAAGHTWVGFDQADGHSMLDGQAVRAASQGCDAAIHLASLLGRPHDDPDLTMAVSLQGTWHVLMAAKEHAMQRVVYFSSVNALGVFMNQAAPDYFPIDDAHPARPRSTYGMSKHLAEEMCRHFTANTGIPTICLRPPAVWLPERYATAHQRWAAEPDAEWAHGWEYGAFCDVRDVAAAAVCGLTCPDPGHVTLLLCADDIASNYPSRTIAAKVHPHVPFRDAAAYAANPFKPLVDNRKAKAVLGWQPQYTWQGALETVK